MKIDRETFLRQLESVASGLASNPKSAIQQGNSFCFQDDKVTTYNGEVACTQDCKLGITAAVPATPLVAILQKLKEEEIDLSLEGRVLKIAGKKKIIELNIEEEIYLPIENVEPAKKWKNLDDEFTEAIQLVQECAKEKADEFEITCLHITSEWIEAHDNYQMARYTLKTGFDAPFLIKRNSIKSIVDLNMTEYSDVDAWVHFRNPAGVTVSCQRHQMEYRDLSGLTKVKGAKTKLPKGLGDAVEAAGVFADEKVGGTGLVKLSLKEGKIRVIGLGEYGKYTQFQSLKYSGPPTTFVISYKLLIEICKRFTECTLSDALLNVTGGAFCFSARLGDPSEVGK